MRLLLALWLGSAALAQVPLQDARNTDTPDPHTHFVVPVYQSAQQWSERREQLRMQILAAAGLLPMPEKTPLNPRVVWTGESNGVVVETVLLETMPGYFVGSNVYRPPRVRGKIPAVLTPHGHWRGGRIENQQAYSVPALAMNLARQGYLVIAWDMVGYNDTRQTPHGFGGPREQLWSFNPLGLQLWNSTRILDYVLSLPEVDPDRVAVTGGSGGGTQTFLLAAVDDRVKVSAPVNMVSASAQGGDPCEEAPGLRLNASNVEFAAMMAGRPMLLVSCSGDWTRNTPREEYPEIRRIYQLTGDTEDVLNAHFDAGHNYNRETREAVYRFLAGRMMPALPDGDIAEHPIELPNPSELLALRHTRLPQGAADYAELFAGWKSAAESQMLDIESDAELRTALTYSIGVHWPSRIDADVEGNRLVLSRQEIGDRISGIWIPGEGPITVVIHPDGAEAALHTPEVASLLAAHRFVYLIDTFQTGAAREPRDRGGDWFLSYNLTDDANRVQDILTVLAFLNLQRERGLRLVGLHNAAVWCLFAAAAAPVTVELQADLSGFRGTDEDFLSRFFVPGIQRAGGLATALRLIRSDLPLSISRLERSTGSGTAR